MSGSYAARVVSRAGAVLANLDAVELGPITWELNRPGGTSIAMHALDPLALEVRPIERELEILRDGIVIFGGVPITAEDGPDRVRFDVAGRLWFFDRRFIGKADRTNFLANPEFESGLASWTTVGTISATLDTTQRKLGTQAAKLVGSAANADAYISQTVTLAAGGIGLGLTVVGWYRVASAGFVGSALNKRGLTVSRVATGVIQESGVYEIDGETPRDSWQRAEATVWIPPNATEQIQVRCYRLGGAIHWDALTLTVMESLGFDRTDQTDVARQIVVHLQDPAFAKSDLGITAVCPASGVLIDRAYQFADHHNGGRALAEFTEVENGFDFAIGIDRVFRTYYPRKGTHRPTLPITADTVSTWSHRFDAGIAATSVTVLGDGDGPDREEGAAVNTSVFGGVILESVISAPTGAEIDTLDTRAAEALRLSTKPEILTVVVPAQGYVGVVDTGDTLPVNIAWGRTAVVGNWRVVRMTLDPAADALTMELNPA